MTAIRQYPTQALVNRPLALQARTRFPVDTRGGGRRLILDFPEELLAEMSTIPDIRIAYPEVTSLTPVCIDILESLCHHLDVTRVRQQPEQLMRDRLTRRDGQARRLRSIRNTGSPYGRRGEAGVGVVEYSLPLDRDSVRRLRKRAGWALSHCDRPVVLRRCAEGLYALTDNIIHGNELSEGVCEGLQRNGWDQGAVLSLVEELQLLAWITLAHELDDTEGVTTRDASLVQPSAIYPGNRCIYCRGKLTAHQSIHNRAGRRCLDRWLEVFVANSGAGTHRVGGDSDPADVRREIRDWWRSSTPRIDEYGNSTHPIVATIERLERLLRIDGPSLSNHRNKYTGWAGTPMEHQPLAYLVYYAVVLCNKLHKFLKETPNV